MIKAHIKIDGNAGEFEFPDYFHAFDDLEAMIKTFGPRMMLGEIRACAADDRVNAVVIPAGFRLLAPPGFLQAAV